jgi:hypothetical protein
MEFHLARYQQAFIDIMVKNTTESPLVGHGQLNGNSIRNGITKGIGMSLTFPFDNFKSLRIERNRRCLVNQNTRLHKKVSGSRNVTGLFSQGLHQLFVRGIPNNAIELDSIIFHYTHPIDHHIVHPPISIFLEEPVIESDFSFA